LSAERLPNLLIVGVPKAGTTSLFDYLAQHPEICGSQVKEPGYFNQFHPLRDPAKPAPSLASYQRQFDHCQGERYLLEGTPSYSYGGLPVIQAVRAVLGRPRIILSLRNPADRLWSAYTFQRAQGHLGSIRSFGHYLSILEQRHASGEDRLVTSRLQGLTIGFYGEYVPAWLEEFGDDCRIVHAEELASRTADVLGELYRWLALDPSPAARADLGRRNVTAHPRSARLANVAFRAKSAANRTGILPARLRRPLGDLYRRFNAGRMNEQFDDELRQRVEAMYASSNEVTARALRAHGYQLPGWLADTPLPATAAPDSAAARPEGASGS
jgi:hypothetical protein